MANKKNWVDFKEVKNAVSMQMMLDKYGVKLKKSGDNHVGCCPIHKGTNGRQFSVNLKKNIWQCFGDCQTGGNVMDFTAMMEFGNKNAASIRKAALRLKSWFLIDAPSQKSEVKRDPEEPAGGSKPGDENGQDADKKENKPLTFELKHLDQDHPWFSSRDISPDTVSYFGLGLQKKGKTIANRVAIPIHDHAGQLVAYCGKAINKNQIKKEGKYKLPAKFIKSDVLYNLHRQKKDFKALILVESFISVWKLHQMGFSCSVALMGSRLTQAQEKLITGFLGPHKRVICMFDADEAGKKCTLDCLNRLSSSVFVKTVDISPYGKKPHLLTLEQIHACLCIKK
jgi:DNA primase